MREMSLPESIRVQNWDSNSPACGAVPQKHNFHCTKRPPGCTCRGTIRELLEGTKDLARGDFEGLGVGDGQKVGL